MDEDQSRELAASRDMSEIPNEKLYQALVALAGADGVSSDVVRLAYELGRRGEDLDYMARQVG